MPRLPRIVVAGQPLHIIQRGNNRQPCFFTDEDRCFYLASLKDAADRHGCRIHAYVLMTNHVHLLLTPSDIKGPSLTLQSVGRRYVRHVNAMHSRSGTLWEGRYKSTLIDSERYLLTCTRYIECNPVRARMVKDPGAYRWSSYGFNADSSIDALVSPHLLYEQLGANPASRRAAYRALFSSRIDDRGYDAIRQATEKGIVLGNDRFREGIERALRRRLDRLPHGGDRRSASFQDQTTRAPYGEVQQL